MNAKFLSSLKGWRKSATGVAIREYWGHFAVWGPFPVHRAIHDDLEFYHRANLIDGVHSEWFDNWPMQWLNFHAATRSMWNADCDMDEIVSSTCRALFGAGGVEVAAMLDSMEQRCEKVPEPAGYGWLEAFSMDDIQFYFSFLDRAAEKIKSSSFKNESQIQRLEVVKNSLELYRLWRLTTSFIKEGDSRKAMETAEKFLLLLDELDKEGTLFHMESSRVGIPRYSKYMWKLLESEGKNTRGWRP